MNEKNFTTSGATIKQSDVKLKNANKIASDKLDIFYIEDFLSKSECEELITLTRKELEPSKLASIIEDDAFRTSSTCYLGYENTPLVKTIDKRICKALGIKNSFSEVIQAQYYEETQEYKAHTDFFDKEEIKNFDRGLGQRTYTFLIYLNDVEEGGETLFPKIGKMLRPQIGTAVIWNNLYENGQINEDTIHASRPVIKGFKAVITKWFRSKSSLKGVTSMFD